ncbi:Plasmodium variant antigen protein Cir/Yir/Bir, putative [Plasmodium berghei]|uniref:Plasmodium variant antigen protein Cir/Yir/Bir, putative n=1 Tax=Plasmodium berghei TaxID=5821 RepID=A0A0Y9VTX0_PLABE|nr:Plasmodium variant antigen protein Cir/Yir/Bir, putative [Plasmodium berghei]SCM20575.1 Plasmodium variant antigen protein Cir/Yir/Bir, putative [Plasmodium berghei]SCN24171.1 Plasmodium variant antigen protein Cir/Yir/Bir, putative [Plasmodium berghei]SCO59430.1 Plasmodium variant antigen protein Cir/Yir/Bir, putative [Plasmodium berghei]SCO60667.1 Plasmodium variant antigen protein Cir/Yir/Bir, putative [Plasmodium berghei]
MPKEMCMIFQNVYHVFNKEKPDLNTIKGITNLQHFYCTYINNDKYKKPITYVTEYKNYKDLIDKTNMMNMDIKDISKFYDNEFAKKYDEIKEDYNNTDSSSYRQIFSTLSIDYNNLKNKYKDVQDSDFPTLPEINTSQNTTKIPDETSEQNSAINSVQNYNVTSSSSIVSKLIPVLSIFDAISVFWGIEYKYSLFGFRKQSQKQHLREKLKK